MGINDFLEIIQKGPEHWNNWRRQNPKIIPKLNGVELLDMNLSGIDFSGMKLIGATISKCDLSRAVLISADLTRSNLTFNTFSHAKMIATKFVNANLSDSDLSGANMLTASVKGATLDRVNFNGHDLKSLDLRGVSLAGCELNHISLSEADLTDTNLSKCLFKNIDFKHTNFSSANLKNSLFIDCELNGANFRHANLENAVLRRMTFENVNFKEANLKKCDLRESHIANTNFSFAKLEGCLLWEVQIKNWKLTKIDCKYAYWDEQGSQKTTYKENEFERIYTGTILIDLHYPYRLSAAEITTLPILIEHLQASFWSTIVRLKGVRDIAGGALVTLAVDEIGTFNPTKLKIGMQDEANRIQMAQLSMRRDLELQGDLKEEIAKIKENFWPRLLELAAESEREHIRNLTIVFMDLKGFSSWRDDKVSEKLSLFRGLLKPILERWHASHPNMEGDSLRITFRNATAGLTCACMIRSVLKAAGFEVRVGVEIGEVTIIHNEVTDISDIEGSAVTMAARLEGAAEHGQVLASEKVKQFISDPDLFDFKYTKARLRKSIGNKKLGDTVFCYAIELLKSPADVA